MPRCVLELPKLKVLTMEYQALTRLPDGMAELKALQGISVAYNPLLESVTSSLCKLQDLERKPYVLLCC